MILTKTTQYEQSPEMLAISKYWVANEQEVVTDLVEKASLLPHMLERIQSKAKGLVQSVRDTRLKKSGLDAFMMKYDLSSAEGIVLMCLAEALLRIPDSGTADKLIKDKLTKADWKKHLGDSDHLFVNAATWSLMLTGRVLSPEDKQGMTKTFNKILNKTSKPIVRKAVLHGMKVLGQQYVMGETIKRAIKRAKDNEKRGYRYSYDMLGEAATTMADAEYYYNEYYTAIEAIGKGASHQHPIDNPGISIKLSALHPRYEVAQIERVHSEMYPKVLQLVELAKSYNIGINIDAEETERLEISLELFRRLAYEPSLKGFAGLGIVVQAYQKRAPFVLDYLVSLAKKTDHRFMVRLVKGAYWDSEIKHAQENNLEDYPVFTRKPYTDVSYQACTKKLFENIAYIYPQFATHNAFTVAMVMECAKNERSFEFQCLHGMGDTLYDHVIGKENYNIPCRIYAPVGTYKHLLPYLVRRLLENGANSSFVNRIVDEQTPLDDLVQDPVAIALAMNCEKHPNIRLPKELFGEERMNSKSYNLNDTRTLETLAKEMKPFAEMQYQVKPLVTGVETYQATAEKIYNPATKAVIGTVVNADVETASKAMDNAVKAFDAWDMLPAGDRAEKIEKLAALLEENMSKLMALAMIESGKTLQNAVNELREAVDFCRYYAHQARAEFAEPTVLPGPTGESNQISLHGRGAMVCISPWNFPLAIFIGQITAALAAGNTVVAKPAEQTPIIAYEAVELMYQAGIPRDVIQLVPGLGETVGATLVEHPSTAGVIFTGSTQVAKIIQATLAKKPNAIIPLIAETGGQNVMVVDSSSLPEQVVRDVIGSSFDSAGQRCSALRVLYLQEDIADNVINMLVGAMKELKIGNPNTIDTDVGPVIDEEAQANLNAHIENMKSKAKLVYQCEANVATDAGTFVLPTVFEINTIQDLEKEVFGPVLHIVRFKADQHQRVVDDVNGTGFGLTFGIHSRIDQTLDFFKRRIKVGNIYINRNIVGAIVGSQPFGGQGLSGTGPKAGGPLYLHRLAVERTISIDTTASGGNASLMSLDA